jgi:hypothetical protein
MARKLQDVIASLPIERQDAIHRGAQHLIAEELHRRNLQRNPVLSQQNKNKVINNDQEPVPTNELPTDTHVHTLYAFVEAMGGDLARFAQFPDRPAVQIRQLEGFLEAIKVVEHPSSVPKRRFQSPVERNLTRHKRKGPLHSLPLR